MDSLKKDGYLPRVIDAQVERYLKAFGAVEIAGTKWCGKTWTSLAHASSLTQLDNDGDRAAAQSDPKLALLGDRPHVIDEWQRVPAVWDAVRQGVDASSHVRGAWILTDSSTPAENPPAHSGAGRIGRLRMLPMSLAESGDSVAAVSLAGLFAGNFEPCKVDDDTLALVDLACRGGWPEMVGDDAETAQLLARSYLQALYQQSGRRGKSPELTERLVTSLARNLGQACTYKTYAADMAGGDDAHDVDTIVSYLDLLRQQYVVDEVPGWVPPARSPKRLRVKPKRYLADPSLAVAALGMDRASLLHDWQTFGLVFEAMAMRDLEVYARALPNAATVPLRYYRDDSGLEADAIIELADGRWAALEVKVGEDKLGEGVDSLRSLRTKLCENPKTRVRPPEFMAVIVGISQYARVVDEGIYCIPLRALGA